MLQCSLPGQNNKIETSIFKKTSQVSQSIKQSKEFQQLTYTWKKQLVSIVKRTLLSLALAGHVCSAVLLTQLTYLLCFFWMIAITLIQTFLLLYSIYIIHRQIWKPEWLKGICSAYGAFWLPPSSRAVDLGWTWSWCWKLSTGIQSRFYTSWKPWFKFSKQLRDQAPATSRNAFWSINHRNSDIFQGTLKVKITKARTKHARARENAFSF